MGFSDYKKEECLKSYDSQTMHAGKATQQFIHLIHHFKLKQVRITRVYKL